MEKTINFKVDEDFYKKIKVKIAKEGKTLKQYITELIKLDLEKTKK